jgi:hypothetical protein
MKNQIIRNGMFTRMDNLKESNASYAALRIVVLGLNENEENKK